MEISGSPKSRRMQFLSCQPLMHRRRTAKNAGNSPDSCRKSPPFSRSMGTAEKQTVKSLHFSKALTAPETITIDEACHRMAAYGVDAVLLTDSNAVLCGLLTDTDIATRVVAQEMNLKETPVAKVMTRNPYFVLSDTLAVEALQKMVQGKFRHLPIVENKEVIGLLDIAKCLYDAITRMERVGERGKALALEGLDNNRVTAIPGPRTFIEIVKDRVFRPSLYTIIQKIQSRYVTVLPTETVLEVTQKLLEFQTASAVVAVDNKPYGILTANDILMRVLAHNLPPESTVVEKVMSPDPVCATVDTTIVEALNIMHDKKFLHLPVIDKDGDIASVVDVIQITHAAVSRVVNTADVSADTSSMMQTFWDAALALNNNDGDEETQSDMFSILASDSGETTRSVLRPISSLPNTFAFKIKDKRGRMHRFTCDSRSLTELITAILQRIGGNIDRNNLPHILYEDGDRDLVVLESDRDLITAVDHAKMAGLRGLRLHLLYPVGVSHPRETSGHSCGYVYMDAWSTACSAVAAISALVAGLGVLAYSRRYSS